MAVPAGSTPRTPRCPAVHRGERRASSAMITASAPAVRLVANGPRPYLAGKHVSHLLGKLGAANRTEAVARARQLGLIP